MPVKVRYRFKNEKQHFVCVLRYSQYVNFRNLPVIAECKIINKNEITKQDLLVEMQEALDQAFKNDINHIKKLSQPEKYV